MLHRATNKDAMSCCMNKFYQIIKGKAKKLESDSVTTAWLKDWAEICCRTFSLFFFTQLRTKRC